MSNKSRKTANVKSSILILLLISVLLIASTYAWFTANKTVTISTLNVHIESANGLQISADGSSWKALLENSDIMPGGTIDTKYTGNTNQIPTELKPVSTIGEVASGKMKMFLGTVEGDSDSTSPTYGQDVLTTTTQTDAHGTTGNYVAFDIFLKVDKDTDIVLTKNSDVIATVPQSGEPDDRGLKNAARVGFVVAADADVQSAGAQLSAIQGVTPSTAYIWQLNNNYHTNAAISHGISNYGYTASNLTSSTIINTYKGVKATGTKIGLNANNTTVFGDVTPQYNSPVGNKTNGADIHVFSSGSTDVSLKAGITKVRVYLWIEGQDIDCENTASGSNLSFDIQFAVKES